MSRSQRPSPQKRGGGKRPGAVDIWKVSGTLPQTEPIAVPTEPGALIRSLGEPPMRDANAATDEFVAVVERAAAIAAALALSADLLAE